MKRHTCWIKGALALVVTFVSSASVVTAQDKDMMGNSWNNPVSASIANILNDRIWERMRAKARARRKSGAVSSADAPVTTAADSATPRKSAARKSRQQLVFVLPELSSPPVTSPTPPAIHQRKKSKCSNSWQQS